MAHDPGIMFESLRAAERRSTERFRSGDTGRLLELVGLDREALVVWGEHVERNATAESSLGSMFVGGFVLALELALGERLDS